MTTWTALTTLTGKARAEALGTALEALVPEPIGIGVFEIEDGSDTWEVGGYFADVPDDIALALLSVSHGAADFVVSEVPDTDWVAYVRRALAPVEAGRFLVYGGHDAGLPHGDRIGLLIEASMAFGTGHHGTTLGCLRAIDRLVGESPPRRVADIGCGTAVLAMAAARVWPQARIVASDIDQVAVDVARVNVDANQLADRVETVIAAGFDAPALAGPFDLVLANILKGPLLSLAASMAAVVAPGGHAVLSGILSEQADDVVAHYREAGFNLVERTEIGDWTTLILCRFDPFPSKF